MAMISRRWVLAALLGGVAGRALARAPDTSPRPQARPTDAPGLRAADPAQAVTAADPQAIIAEAKLGGVVAYAVADAETGLLLESREAGAELPPASTAKAVTALYALAHLGPDYRFVTRVLATGPVAGGVVQGDLVLAGGGDPHLSTDDLGDLAAKLAAAGVTGVAGRYLVWGGALPQVDRIADDQPDQVGYNPAVGGLNLNFNRVHFGWERHGADYALTMDARGARFQPAVAGVVAELSEADLPVYRYDGRGPRERWTVARSALGKAGSRWLPLRRPAQHAAEVFATLARAQGISLPAAEEVASLPQGTVLVEHQSVELREILKEMLEFSTNLTAEVVGMTVSRQLGATSLAQSAAEMTRWFRAQTGASATQFADHSGLSGDTRVTAADMVAALVGPGRRAGLRGLMKDIPLRDGEGRPIPDARVKIAAKTGTLNFVSALAGYATAPDGAEMAFAILTGDLPRRAAIPVAERERPKGGRSWARRSRQMQQKLIERWAAVYG